MKHYNKLIVLLALFSQGCSLPVRVSKTRSLNYSISYHADPEPALFVQVYLRGDSSGKTRVIVPHAWAWQDDYEKGIQNVKLLSPGGQIMRAENGIDYEVRHSPGQTVQIQYEVRSYWDGPINRDVYYRPIIKSEYFHFIGHGVFIRPDWDASVPKQIRIEWQNMPDEWQTANSFGVNKRRQTLKRSIDALCHAVYLAGDFSIQKSEIKGFPVYIALRGEWKFPVNDLSVMVESIVTAVRDFWEDYAFPYFLISMIPIDAHYSKGGTGLTDSFALFVSDDHENLDDLRFLLTHELFHTWNGRKIQREEPEELVYWFSEGFTDYYTRLILLRNGLITLKEFIFSYNQVLMEYFRSPAVNAANEEILDRTHTDRHTERIPYLRGDILAFRWNNLIRKTSGRSLDDLMFDLLHESQTSGMKVSMENIEQLMKKRVPGGVEQDMERYIVRGETLSPGANDLGPGAVLAEEVTYSFQLGFTYEESDTSKDWMVTEVKRNTPVWRAGLRTGHIITGRSIYWGKADKPVVLVFIKDNGEKERIEYLPRGEEKTVPQYRIDEAYFQQNPAECLKWFGVTDPNSG
jgi:predicted metalloprotease with PDZ domain